MNITQQRKAYPNEMPSLADFQWLVSLIRRLRPDLCRKFKTHRQISLEFASWLVANGTKEYQSLIENAAFQRVLSQPLPGICLTPLQSLIYLERLDVRKIYPLPSRRSDYLHWFYCHGVAEHKLWPWLSVEDWNLYGHYAPEQVIQYAKNLKAKKKPTQNRPMGVNLVGYAFGQIGIGEDVRMTARALQSAHVPCCIVNFPPGKEIPQSDYSMKDLVCNEGPYAVNIFCMTALETGRFYAERGKSQFEGRYNIGYWPWELARWPDAWMDLTRLVDEVWVSTRHIYDALAPCSLVPVQIMPLAVELGEVGTQTRADFGLPGKSYLFCFSFDLNSSIHRKNPEACLKAFQKAFPVEQAASDLPVGLVVKTHVPKKRHVVWEHLKQAAASDPRIHIIEETLPRPDLLALYGCCDCFLSLHRAEGFGRGIAEALLLGLRVIATGYSGNMDYCRNNPQVTLVDYTLVPVGEGEYPYGEGQVWAEPDVDAAAQAMRRCLETGRATPTTVGPHGAAPGTQPFSCAAMGARYAARLRWLHENRKAVAA